MASLTLDSLSVTAEETSIRLTLSGAAEVCIELNAGQAEMLERFLTLHRPQERRTGFRVPVLNAVEPDQQTLTCALRPRLGKTREVEPVDLSLTGVLVRAPDLPVRAGQQVTFQMRLGNLNTTHIASVVRQEGDLVALHFPETLRHGELDPPESLVSIYRELERRWLRHRIATDE